MVSNALRPRRPAVQPPKDAQRARGGQSRCDLIQPIVDDSEEAGVDVFALDTKLIDAFAPQAVGPEQIPFHLVGVSMNDEDRGCGLEEICR